MLTVERHQRILQLLQEAKTVKIHELVEMLQASESTIRRDLSQLEKEGKLKRLHGGATLFQRKREEPSLVEKASRKLSEKNTIAAYAASLVERGDCIYLDAGTTAHQMIAHLDAADIIVVTNGLNHVKALLDKGIETYVIGGYVKPRTEAFIGQGAMNSLRHYRFDKTFIGVNGLHPAYGYTTPDPEEAAVKALALEQGQETYVLADHTKFYETAFSLIADLSTAVILTDGEVVEGLEDFQEHTKVVTIK
ncbi:DeoR/GlpR transcriptional regulator [Ornithinibacillus gellani]|uniref:DeoR/GlpR family DNA-binding transcription regulator n=1 Tax=Ornithinibacillus gellani TaxID=2293253 RepID=UPI000F486D9F|nr:DeoR/GlpR family DNA-binding transcription regulator [Ornithinibacillus gellani]TQS75279.1 DeoR/GlpR transcriptional regulator [Ornithinibacillus gellani]